MKKLIKNYLKKHLNCSHPKHYYFLRFLSEMVKDDNSNNRVFAGIARFMSNNRINLPFSDIFVIDNIIYVYTLRPGLWIGRGGETIKKIENEINYNIEGQRLDDYSIQLLEEYKNANYHIHHCICVYNDF